MTIVVYMMQQVGGLMLDIMIFIQSTHILLQKELEKIRKNMAVLII